MLFSNEKVWEFPFSQVPRLFGHCPQIRTIPTWTWKNVLQLDDTKMHGPLFRKMLPKYVKNGQRFNALVFQASHPKIQLNYIRSASHISFSLMTASNVCPGEDSKRRRLDFSSKKHMCSKEGGNFLHEKYSFLLPQMVHPPPVLLSGPTARHSLEHMGPHRSHCNISLWLVRFYYSLECTKKKYHLFLVKVLQTCMWHIWSWNLGNLMGAH